MSCHYRFSLHRFVRENQVSIKKTLSDSLRSIAILARFLLISKSSLGIEPNYAHENARDSHVEPCIPLHAVPCQYQRTHKRYVNNEVIRFIRVE